MSTATQTTTTTVTEKETLKKLYSLTVNDLKEQVEGRTSKNLDGLVKTFKTSQMEDKMLEFLGKGIVLESEKVEDVQLAIMLLQVGFGIADKDKEHIHNTRLLEFLLENGYKDIAQKFLDYWDGDPLNAEIRYVPAIRIYNSTNELVTNQIIKIKSRATKLVTLPTTAALRRKPESEVPFRAQPAEDLNWNKFFLKLRG